MLERLDGLQSTMGGRREEGGLSSRQGLWLSRSVGLGRRRKGGMLSAQVDNRWGGGGTLD